MIGIRGALSVIIAIILCAALTVVGWNAQSIVATTIAPTISAKGESLARASAALIERALKAGIPLDQLVGVDTYFAELREANPEVSGIALVAAGGNTLVKAGTEIPGEGPPVQAPVTQAGQQVAAVVMWTDPGIISSKVRAMLLDIAFLGVVALLIALELLALAVGSRSAQSLGALEARLKSLARGKLVPAGGSPHLHAVRELTQPIDAQLAKLWDRHHELIAAATAQGNQAALAELQQLADKHGLDAPVAGESRAAAIVRPALFLFMMADELTRPFLPGFVRTIAPTDSRFSVDLLVSLPMVVFMITMALCQLPFAGWSERLGRREGFLAGTLIAAAGYALSGWTGDYGTFMASRVVTAVGYILVFVSAQGHIIDGSTAADRTRSLAVFVGAILVAALCGPPIGGVIADRLGAHSGFYASALLAVLAAGAGLAMLPRTHHTQVRSSGLAISDITAAIKAPRLLSLLFGCAFPAKFILAALCFYLVPVELAQQGYSTAEIGRLQMIYPLMMVLGVPVFASLADRFKQRTTFVIAGCVVAGAGTLFAFAVPTPAVIAAILLMLGLGQAMSIASQSSLVADSARHVPGGRSAGVLGLFRVVERGGNAAGPAVAGALFGIVGFSFATLSIGVMVLAGALGYAFSAGSAAKSIKASLRP